VDEAIVGVDADTEPGAVQVLIDDVAQDRQQLDQRAAVARCA
jgi:hypothetical protein